MTSPDALLPNEYGILDGLKPGLLKLDQRRKRARLPTTTPQLRDDYGLERLQPGAVHIRGIRAGGSGCPWV